MNRTIFIYWDQGFDHAPALVKKCLDSWVFHNADHWRINVLDWSTLGDVIDVRRLRALRAEKSITHAALSDAIRIELLSQLGGLWVDATLFCRRPLVDWFGDEWPDPFFAFCNRDHRRLASWFLYGEPESYLIKRWREAVRNYLDRNSVIGRSEAEGSEKRWLTGDQESHYFWFHYLFGDLVSQDAMGGQLWESIGKQHTEDMSLIFALGIDTPLTPKNQAMIDRVDPPVYKLTYRSDPDEWSGSVGQYALDLLPQRLGH